MVQRHNDEITMRAVRANWPIIVLGLLVIVSIARTEFRVDVLDALAQAFTPERLAQRAGERAVMKYRLDVLEKRVEGVCR